MTAADKAVILRLAELAAHDRGNGATTIPLVTASRGATGYLTGITKFAADSAIAHHFHNVAESVMVIKGDAIVDIDGHRSSLSTFDATFVPGNVPHHFENASPDSEMWILWVYGSVDATRTIVASGESGRVDAESQRTGAPSPLIHEIAEIVVKAGHEEAFEESVARAVPLFQSAPGARGMRLDRSMEDGLRYTLVVIWETLDDHVTYFRRSPQFLEWRALINDHVAGSPIVYHVRNVLTGF